MRTGLRQHSDRRSATPSGADAVRAHARTRARAQGDRRRRGLAAQGRRDVPLAERQHGRAARGGVQVGRACAAHCMKSRQPIGRSVRGLSPAAVCGMGCWCGVFVCVVWLFVSALDRVRALKLARAGLRGHTAV